MKPLIGITTEVKPDHYEGRGWLSTTLLTTYAQAVADAGALPLILPLANQTTVRDTLFRLDGLIMSGGMDIPAEVIGELPHPTLEPMQPARWPSECLWLETALEMEKPILGICLGMQIMGVAAGSGLMQDIASCRPDALQHAHPSGQYRHEIKLEAGTRLAALAPSLELTITSSHHQAIKRVPEGYRLAAASSDGIIEAIERPDRPFVIGVQWHPERDPQKPSWLLQAFVEECKKTVISD